MAAVRNSNEIVQERLQRKPEREEQHRVRLDALLNEQDVASITGMSVASVRRWRLYRCGPRYVKLGSAVRYRVEDIKKWIETRPAGGGQQTTP
jgi:predicted DNA-binding transcriptional regulator AlpA